MYKKDAHTFAKRDVEGEIPCTTTTTTSEGQEHIKVAFKYSLMFKKWEFCEIEWVIEKIVINENEFLCIIDLCNKFM